VAGGAQSELKAPLPAAWRFDARGRDAQARADVAVIVTTVLRPSLEAALASVFRQDFAGHLQLLVGVDRAAGSVQPLLDLLAARPEKISALVLYPGYSTSTRHGGLHKASDGGALRTVLSYLANAPLLAYLDDDNAWLPNHLSSLAGAIAGFDWAYSLRMFVDERTGRDLCVDIWDAAGPGKGVHRGTLGGFSDVNCLMIDKTRAEDALPLWSIPLSKWKATADRQVFRRLCLDHPAAWSGLATVRYAIRPSFYLWPKIRRHVAAVQRAPSMLPLDGA
jgi:hypothetical protein